MGSAHHSPIYAYVNPENFSLQHNPVYEPTKELNSSAGTLTYKNTESTNLKFSKILVDSTGVIVLPDELKSHTTVDGYVETLRTTLQGYVDTMHAPPFVKISWGSLSFIGVCTSFSVNYVMFDPDGCPIRAFVDLQFNSTKSFETKTIEAAKKSPDMTHIRTVQAGDTLPLMTYKIYGDSSYYLEVARANGLSGMNEIKPGDKLAFPPLKRQ